MTENIMIIGGHGKVALRAEPLLADAGHHVTAMIRNPQQQEDVKAAGATPLVLDIEHATREQLRNRARVAVVPAVERRHRHGRTAGTARAHRRAGR